MVFAPNVPPPVDRMSVSPLAVRNCASAWRWMIVRQPLGVAAGRIHADSVIADLKLGSAEFATRTTLFVPLTFSALP